MNAKKDPHQYILKQVSVCRLWRRKGDSTLAAVGSMAPSTHDKEKKSRWRSMLGGGRDAKEDNNSHLRPGPDPVPDPVPSSKDSAYGSQRTSGQPSPRPQSSEPSETNVKQDPSTGNIVTTTVTTTTTTTTVTTRNGTVIETVSSPTVEADATSRIPDSGGSISTTAVQNIRPQGEHFNQGVSRPTDPRRNPAPNAPNQINNSNNPAELDATIQGATSGGGGGGGGGADGPPIPVKSNRRKSREIHMPWPRPTSGLPRPTSELTEPPVSPMTPSHNFSYPARTSPHVSQLSLQDPRPSYPEQPQQGHQLPQGQPPYAGQYPQLYQGQHPYQHPPSDAVQNGVADSTNRQNDRPGTWQNLKGVASGVHGAGEVLRGTVNSKIIDRHAPPPRQKEHQQVVHQGADELKRFYGSQGKAWLAAVSRKPVGDDGAP